MNQSVEKTLDGYFKKPLRKLPEFQLRVVQYHIKNWNGLSESERRKKAQTIDICRQTKKRLTLERYESRALQITEAGHHPRLQGFPTRYERRAPQITEAEQQKYLSEFEKAWQLDNEIEDIQSEIDRCKSIVPVSHADDVLGQTRISELEAKKAEIERQYLALKGEVPESMPVVQAPDQTEAVVPVTNKLDDETKNDEWKVFAQLKAKEYIKQQREADLYPSQENISDHIAREFRATGIVGADKKPLSGATIKRHALKGISSAVGKRLSTTRIQGK